MSVFDTFWVGPGLGGGCSVEAFLPLEAGWVEWQGVVAMRLGS